jgi:S-methylmethionine-dependent homocysteine/selenocysteine methylase
VAREPEQETDLALEILLDGGVGQELVRRAGRATPLWSIEALLNDPELVAAVHDDFFAAGADMATTNTYSLLPDRLKIFGLLDRLEELTLSACEIAARSRDKSGGGLVAGALGPPGFSYRTDLRAPVEEIAETYARCARIQASVVDVLLLETISSVEQAECVLSGAGQCGKPIWIAFTVDDEDGSRLRSGEPVSAIRPVIDRHRPEAVLFNCSTPEAISRGMPVLASLGGKAGAYANGFSGIAAEFDSVGATTDILAARQDIGPERYASFVDDWVAGGATICGGCCEIGPSHIAEIRRRYPRRGETGQRGWPGRGRRV